MLVGGPAVAQIWDPDLQLGAVASLRIVLPDVVRARHDGGESRVRYGDGSDWGGDVLFSIGEIAAEIDAAANPWMSLFLHAQYQPEDKHAVGIVRGFLEIVAPPIEQTTLRLRGGAYFPGVSRQNREVGWSNSYTLTNSAAMTWIAEEVRPIGVTLTASHNWQSFSATLEGGFFFANDASGAALALGGFALNDIKTTLTGEVRTFDPFRTAGSPGAPEVVEPFQELDGDPGYHVLGKIDFFDYGGASILYWDNRGDTSASRPDSVVWDTKFFAAEMELFLPLKLELFPGFMVGKTRNPELGTDFWTVSILVARDFGRLRTAVRYDHFDQDDERGLVEPSLDEEGDALTTAVSYSIGSHHRIAAEVVYVAAEREAPAADGQTRELMAQLEYRLVF